VADAQLDAAIANWEPRVVANGVDVNDYRRIAGSVQTWPEWLPAWESHGDSLAKEAAEREERGHAETAGELWRRAASSYHFGRFVWILDLELHARASAKAVAALAHAHRLLDPTARRLEIPFDSAKMVAILRRPKNVDSAPLVVLVCGLDSTKEEFFDTEEIFHRRGLATLTLEGPGQGETGIELPIRPDFDVPFGAALDYVAEEAAEGLDLTRVGAIGFSLGGYYVPRVAAFEKRLTAAVAVSGPYTLSDFWDERPLMTRATFQHHAHAADETEAKAKAAELTLAGVAHLIEQPLLVITGDHDRLVPWQETKRIADEAKRGEWKLYEGGNHVVNNMPYKYKTLSADWLREQLITS
jgi:2,6-dihydroxypseudooxynicotine hydrolase